MRKKLWIFRSRLFTAVPRSQVFPPWPPWLRRPPVEPRSLVGSSGGRTLVDRGARGGPRAEPGSLAELAGNDGELAGVCRVCPSHENLHQLPPPHLTAPRTCAAWYPIGQSILNYLFFLHIKHFSGLKMWFIYLIFLPELAIPKLHCWGYVPTVEFETGREWPSAGFGWKPDIKLEITILEFSQRNLQKVSRIFGI